MEARGATGAVNAAASLADAFLTAGNRVGLLIYGLYINWTNPGYGKRQRENILRQSLVPSLLACRAQNERHKNLNAQLFEFSRVFLGTEPDRPETQPTLLSFVSGR